jgi:hypothetical protein
MSNEIEPELLDHLISEFGDEGIRAADFLRTAQALRSTSLSDVLRLPATIAYCLREAMKAIPSSQAQGDGGQWRELSRRVTDARRRHELVRGKPGAGEEEALTELFVAIDELDTFHKQGESVHEQRLIAIMLRRTGSVPLSAGTAPIREYQTLLSRLDNAVHGEVEIALANELWDDVVAILRRFFMPPEMRRADLDSLAGVESPTGEDFAMLTDRLVSPQDLQYFLARITGPAWLDQLSTTDLLDPPSSSGAWPMFSAVERLSASHPDALISVLAKLNDMYGRDPRKAWYIGRAAVDLGEVSMPLITTIVREHSSNVSIAQLGVMAAESVEPSDDSIEELGDILLNAQAWDAFGAPATFSRRLVDGIDADNWRRRIDLIVFKLRKCDEQELRLLGFERGGSIADPAGDEERERSTILIRALVTALLAARPHSTTSEMRSALNELPAVVVERLDAWLLSTAHDVAEEDRIAFIADAIRHRQPTGDDLRLVDAVGSSIDSEHQLDPWTLALGDPPAITEVALALKEGTTPPEWLRALGWIGLLPASTVSEWASASAVLATRYGRPGRSTLTTRSEVMTGWGHSPIDLEDLRAASPIDAARLIAQWRPDGSDWLASPRELGRALQTLVTENPSSWASEPIAIVTALRQPIYISHYLDGLASAGWPEDGDLQQLLDVVVLVQTGPWPAEVLGRDDFDYDPDWQNAARSSIQLIKKLTEQDVTLGDRTDQAWNFVASAARDRSQPSGLISGARDPMDSAINRASTRAFEAAISFMAYEFRERATVREDALALLDEALALSDVDGQHFRAILAPRLGFIRHIAPEWFNENRDTLFGAAAPPGMAQLTIDLAIKWGQPQRWLLEEHRASVYEAVQRGVDHALEQALIAMLWTIPGYEPTDVLKQLRQLGNAYISAAGEALARMLRADGVSADVIGVGIDFWRGAVRIGSGDALHGFGWFSEVKSLDDDTWEAHTLATLDRSNGQIAWAHQVAERAINSPTESTRLSILNHLIRAAGDEWDRRLIVDKAVVVLRSATNTNSNEYQRLHTALLERGAL